MQMTDGGAFIVRSYEGSFLNFAAAGDHFRGRVLFGLLLLLMYSVLLPLTEFA
jgi:hypothetical protein